MNKVLEFEVFVPEAIDWTIDKIRNNPSRLIRLKQIRTLTNYFLDLDFDLANYVSAIKSLTDGEFITGRDPKQYQALFSSLDSRFASAGHIARNVLECMREFHCGDTGDSRFAAEVCGFTREISPTERPGAALALKMQVDH